ncbi:MAG TPA: beta-ketoacyl-ACP synthase II [Gemmatimonadaceae bacterium]|jgi:3-oxoacyl-[acyl-carrier-protein] synthase II|nr:beta-ketoacyl-ACP synthase II [Gemmatimonadota bacterium]HNV77407.1 beta-ketoacyl-ACP synthase II [Gemmatimonadaceae bacterium]HPV76358.1 beta-ketoacyl-ACP synthase II [Gemmatimonadaceae bacterium]
MSDGSRIVVTGIGVVTSIGSTRESFWRALTAGVSGVAPIAAFDASQYQTQIGSEVRDFDPQAYMTRKLAGRMGRNSQMAVAAAMGAVKDAGLDLASMDSARVGCCVGTAAGDFNELEENHAGFLQRGPKAISPFCVPKVIPNMPAGNVAIALGIHGPNFAALSACATGAHSIGMALLLLRTGQADVMLAGGVESTITPFVLNGYSAMGALSKRNDVPAKASRPFDKTRDGFVMGEGAGVLVLETLAHARARGAEPIAEVAGFGMTADAFGLAQPDPEATWTTRAMELALRDAGMSTGDVQYINAHGTSTPANDRSEAKAIGRVFGETPPLVSSIKSMIGHTLGAAGAIEAAATVLTIKYGVIPPTINYEVPDEEIALDVVPNVARAVRVDGALSNSFGFGGQNGVLAFRRV